MDQTISKTNQNVFKTPTSGGRGRRRGRKASTAKGILAYAFTYYTRICTLMIIYGTIVHLICSVTFMICCT